jgi:rSAM/selenodomain-associated transferase 1
MRQVALMTRAPSAGGKTRLTAGLSQLRARSLREALFIDTLQVARALEVPLTVFATPAACLADVQALAADVAVHAQIDGDLGEKMLAAFSSLFGQGARRVVLIGSDLPTLPASRLHHAFELLDGGADLVLGPAEDGGYYLIGSRRLAPAVFDGMSWGSADVLAQTRAAAAANGLRLGEVGAWYDVDTPDDLLRLAADPAPARHTRAWLAADGSV